MLGLDGAQRSFDVAFALIAIVFLSPLLLVTCLILRLTGEGEVLYFQPRVGRNDRVFNLIKFATMLKDSPNLGAGDVTVKNDPRVLPFGKLLRKTKVNELPQLLNIVKGDMSLVGPRPMVPNTYSKYPFAVRDKLKEIRPGLTGIGSLFFRDEEKLLDGKANPNQFYDQEILPYKCDLEVWYVENTSLLMYFLIILLTALAVIMPNWRIPAIFFKQLPEPPQSIRSFMQ